MVEAADAYERALKKVMAGIAKVEEELASLDRQRMDRLGLLTTLRETAAGLSALLGNDLRQPITELGLTDACRQVVRSARSAMSAVEIRDQLYALKYDFSGYEKPISSIGTALNRMVERGEITVDVADDGTKRFTQTEPLERLKRLEQGLIEGTKVLRARERQLLGRRGKK